MKRLMVKWDKFFSMELSRSLPETLSHEVISFPTKFGTEICVLVWPCRLTLNKHLNKQKLNLSTHFQIIQLTQHARLLQINSQEAKMVVKTNYSPYKCWTLSIHQFKAKYLIMDSLGQNGCQNGCQNEIFPLTRSRCWTISIHQFEAISIHQFEAKYLIMD